MNKHQSALSGLEFNHLTKGVLLKKIKKSVVAAAAIATIGSMGAVGLQAVHATSNTSTRPDPMSSLIDKLVSKFNLNKADVQQVFDENRTAMDAQRQADQSAKLQKLVDAGTITATQKTAIEAKIKELEATREANKSSMQSLTDTERKAKMDTERTAMEAWAKTNGIDLTKLQGIFMRGHGGLGGPPPSAASSTN